MQGEGEGKGGSGTSNLYDDCVAVYSCACLCVCMCVSLRHVVYACADTCLAVRAGAAPPPRFLPMKRQKKLSFAMLLLFMSCEWRSWIRAAILEIAGVVLCVACPPTAHRPRSAVTAEAKRLHDGQ